MQYKFPSMISGTESVLNLVISLKYFDENYSVIFRLDYAFVRHQDKDCLWRINLHDLRGSREVCAEWCASNTTCSGFVHRYGNCFYKEPPCRNDIFLDPPSILYLKEMVEG